MADQTPTPMPTADARQALDRLLGHRIRATVTRSPGSSVEVVTGILAAEGTLYTATDATIRYPDASVHVDHMHLVDVKEAEPAPDTIADAARIAHDLILRRTDGDTELADIIRRGVLDAYRTGWHRALIGHEDAPEPAPTYRDGVRDALAAAAREAERANPYTGPAALASAIRMMGTAGPLAQDGPVQVRTQEIGPCACGTASIVCACGDSRCPACDPTCSEGVPGPPSELPAAADLAAHIAEALYVEPSMDTPTAHQHALMQAAHRAHAAMTAVAPVLAARDARIAELEAKADHLADVAERRKQWSTRRRQQAQALARELDKRDGRLAAVRSVLATWEHRAHVGDTNPLPKDLFRDLQAALRDRPAAHTEDPAATWPTRAVRRLADDAHPTAEGSTT